MATVYIDNHPFEVDDKQNMLAVALSLGFNLPYFCFHPALGSVGACRQCAVKQFRDEQDTRGKLVMACMTPAKNGTRISVEDPDARAFRASVVEWLMLNHPHDCPVCDEGGECHLQDMTVMTGHDYRRYRGLKRTYRNQYLGPFVNHEFNRCIQCYRCVRFYRDYADGRDFNAFALRDIVFFGRAAEGVLESEFSGNLVEVCPTGVFTDATFKHHYTRKWDLQTAPSVCVNCSLGCNTIPGERYGQLRRIRARYNGQVNGYFLCDRGRYGYEFVNDESRIRNVILTDKAERGNLRALLDAVKPGGAFAQDAAGIASPSFPRLRDPLAKTDRILPAQAMSREQALIEVHTMIAESKGIIGIGSPRASLESNFALRTLVGAEHFYLGLSENDNRLLPKMISLLQNGPARSPSLKDVESADAVLVLGEDVTNVAPMLALALRQSVRCQPKAIADQLGIAEWDDKAVREAEQDKKGPLFLATPSATKLEDVATAAYHAAPDDIARLGFAIAHELAPVAPQVDGLSAEATALARRAAEALRGAKRPLIIAGPSMASEAIVDAAANVVHALSASGHPADLSFTFPEANSLGLALIGGRPLQDAFRAVEDGAADTAIILENDLFRRADAGAVNRFLDACKHLLVLDYLVNPTVAKAEAVLPAATFAEADGTFVNNEGRVQRLYQIFVPQGHIQASWRWLDELINLSRGTEPWSNLDGIVRAMTDELPILKPLLDVAPPADFRIAGQKIAREPARYSGRTAMFAHISVHEPQPPEDPDSPLAFSMEGFQGEPPPALIPRFWAPGWNSVQAINKFQIEVAGPLRGGDPGRRLLEPGQAPQLFYSKVPEPFQRRSGEWLVVPLYHIFGSEELSSYSRGIAELSPHPYVALNPEDARRLSLADGKSIRLDIDSHLYQVAVRLAPELPEGVAGLPVGLKGLEWTGLTAWARLQPIE